MSTSIRVADSRRRRAELARIFLWLMRECGLAGCVNEVPLRE